MKSFSVYAAARLKGYVATRMGTHLKEPLLDSVVENVTKHANCSVLMARQITPSSAL